MARSLRIHRRTNRKFSSSSRLSVERRGIYYPNEKIKSMDDFCKYASPEEKAHLVMIQAEYVKICKSNIANMPELTDQEWLIHMNYDSRKGREKHLRLLQVKKDTQEVKKQKRQPQTEPQYNPTNFFQELFWMSEKKIIQNRVARATMLEDPILVDLGYADMLYYNEIIDVARHLFLSIGDINRSALNHTPTFNVIFCNVKPSVEENEILKTMRRLLTEDCSMSKLPVTLTEKSYLDLFPKRDLVYLSPDAEQYYHPAEGIPVIAGLIHKTTKDKLALHKAYKEKIKVRRLPIDLIDKLTVPRLPINHIIQYVAALRFTRDLEIARKALPKRIISGPAAKGKKISKIL